MALMLEKQRDREAAGRGATLIAEVCEIFLSRSVSNASIPAVVRRPTGGPLPAPGASSGARPWPRLMWDSSKNTH